MFASVDLVTDGGVNHCALDFVSVYGLNLAPQVALERALSVLKMHPRFPDVQVQIGQRLKDEAPSDEAGPDGTDIRLKWVLRRVDVKAEEYLSLVTDTTSQEAFSTVLVWIEREGWREYSGFPIERLRPGHPQTEAAASWIHHRADKWVLEGYKRLISHRGKLSNSFLGGAATSRARRKKPGPKTDFETARRVFETATKFLPAGGWKSQIDDLCMRSGSGRLPSRVNRCVRFRRMASTISRVRRCAQVSGPM